MQDFMYAVMFGFQEILRARTMKFALTSGLIISFVWIVIGSFFFDGIVSFSSSILSLVPFSMIRSNGAWMLSTFLWLQAVLITFALIFAFVGNLIVQKIEREKYVSLSLLIGLVSALFWSIVWFYEGGYIYAQFLKLLTWLPFETIEKGLAYLIGFYVIYTAIIVTIIFVTSTYSTPFLQKIAKQYFPYDKMYDDYEYKAIQQTLKDTLIFVGASIVSFPLLFIPIVNFFILVGLWIWLMKDTLALDTASFVFGEEYKKRIKEYKIAIWGITFVGSLFNFIPVFNVFASYFTELALFYYFKEKRDL
ncbi:Probable transmembrane protein [hydrothermal vent metagenome]|uniref:Probable transmembrane protein n=1 Tax=hydrothermal vent metagenome TaxID=652676 RepID=A0A1W1D3Z2_9ZZZZ